MGNQIPVYFRESLKRELENILSYWKQNTIDHTYGGFYGRIDHNNTIDTTHFKGIILNTRILWTFSRANTFYGDDRYKSECERSITYLSNHFRDVEHGGVHWEVDFQGNPTNKRKQIYAQAFCIYALAEYYKFSKDEEALEWAMALFSLIEEKAYDNEFDGYFEAFGEHWEPIADVRLSQKDLNSPKTTNTHLHILEAYTTLFEVARDPQVKKALGRLITLFQDKMYGEDGHLKLFFSKDWKEESTEISFGHDIEAAWLLILAARTIDNPNHTKACEKIGVGIANTFLKEALTRGFGVVNSQNRITKEIDTDHHWWPQIEAMVGLIYIWDITNKDIYLEYSLKIWDFAQEHILDPNYGEWFFRVDRNGNPYTEENKVGPWKCPYHNSRGLMEILKLP
ncbi:MAG: AGE family epimerase/isomerase [Bacteroidota bacterium]